MLPDNCLERHVHFSVLTSADEMYKQESQRASRQAEPWLVILAREDAVVCPSRFMCVRGSLFLFKSVPFCFINIIFEVSLVFCLSDLSTQHGARTHDPKTKSRMF